MSAGNSEDGASASSNGQSIDRDVVLCWNRKDGTLGKNVCITNTKKIEFAFAWTIKNFSVRKDDRSLGIYSSIFSFGSVNELQWRLMVQDLMENDLCVSLHLVSSSYTSVPTKFAISILNDRNERVYTRGYSERNGFKIFSIRELYSFKEYINFDFLLDEANGLLPDDNLILLCEGTSYLHDTEALSYPSSYQPQQIDAPKCTLLEKFGSLFENQEFSDFTLSVEGKDLPVHKVIVAAQSSVFAAMFKYEMEENKQNRVTIEDISYDVLREMLLYIYTGNLQNFDEMARELLVAADKYDVSGLKEICEASLWWKLTVENAVDLLVFADTYSAKQLKMHAMLFISTQSANAKAVMLKSAWTNKNSYPESVIIELLEALTSK